MIARWRAEAGSSAAPWGASFYAGQWERRQRLQGKSSLILWGMKDSAFRPYMLGRWKEDPGSQAESKSGVPGLGKSSENPPGTIFGGCVWTGEAGPHRTRGSNV